MGFGRFLCVGLPFGLTIASVVFLLISGLSGVTTFSPALFTMDTKNFSMSVTALANLTSLKPGDLRNLDDFVSSQSVNLTAANLQLADSYSFYLWSYVSTTGAVVAKNATRFDYASAFNASTITTLAAANGLTATIPSAVKDGLVTFAFFIKLTEILFMAAAVLSGLTLVIGLFGFCSKIGSCCTYIICGLATTACIAFAGVGTATILVVKGFLELAARFGIGSTMGTNWMVLAWTAVAFSLAAGLFWLFSACCCSSSSKERRNKHKSTAGDYEKPYSGYQRVHDPFNNTPQQSGIHVPQSFPMQMWGTRMAPMSRTRTMPFRSQLD